MAVYEQTRQTSTTSQTPNATPDYKFCMHVIILFIIALIPAEEGLMAKTGPGAIIIIIIIYCDREPPRSHECQRQPRRPSPPLTKAERGWPSSSSQPEYGSIEIIIIS